MSEQRLRPIAERAYEWSLQVIRLCKLLPKSFLSEIIFRQLVRSATSVAANLVEGGAGLSKKDFTKCYGISLKECNESKLWLRYISDTDLLTFDQVKPLLQESHEIANIIAAIVIKSRRTL